MTPTRRETAGLETQRLSVVRQSTGEVSLGVKIHSTISSGFTGTRTHVSRHVVLLSKAEADDLRRYLEDMP